MNNKGEWRDERSRKGNERRKHAAALPISGAPLMGLIAVIMILFFVGTGFWLKARKG